MGAEEKRAMFAIEAGQSRASYGVEALVWIATMAVIGRRVVDKIPNAGELTIDPMTPALVALFFIAGYFLCAVTLAGVGSAAASASASASASAK